MGERFGAPLFCALVPINNKRRLRLRQGIRPCRILPLIGSISNMGVCQYLPVNKHGTDTSLDNSGNPNPMGMLGLRAYCI